jgi:predicted phosphodiesterase
MVERVVRWANEKPNRYIVIVGDVFNAALKTSVSDTYSETMTLNDAIKWFGEFVKDIGKEKILVVLRGNHDNRVNKAVGLDPVEVACELAGVPYGGAEAYLALQVGNWGAQAITEARKRKPVTYLMFLNHGTGGGRSMGGKVNSMMRNGDIVVADIYVSGHIHQPACIPATVCTPDTRYENIIERNQFFVSVPAFLKREGYAKDAGYAPVSKMFSILTLSGSSKAMEGTVKEI